MLIYKIFQQDEWAALQRDGETSGAPIDVQDGFVHFSTGAQVRETAALHFAAQSDLMLLAVESEPLGADLKWETSRGGAAFPHLFRKLRLKDVLWSRPLPLVDGTHDFPPDLS